MPWDFALILGVLGFLIPWRGAARVRELLRRPALTSNERIRLYLSTIVAQWAAAALVLWRARARGIDFDALGMALPEPGLTLAVAFVLCLAFAAVQILSFRRLARLPPERRGLLGQLAEKLMPQGSRETVFFIALAATAGLCEEFLYRGFVFAAVERATGSLAFAGLASSLFFAVAHLYQGPRGLMSTFGAGLIFAAARMATGSLVAPVAAHFLADAMAGLAARRSLATPERPLAASLTDK